ncbi:EAL and HDOD domain-containing protein [Halomonas sp. GXIMD04776]|uniref:EAL and HDOD domain-containing protein n=1 Tax=Halomonas sp. GXIMD04776 TaxID=3415605 RepID=UPI003CA4882A
MDKPAVSGATTVLFARQPIYDRKHQLAGCELLFRPCADINAFVEPFDGDLATHQVMISAFTETNIRDVCENTPAFINFTANTLQAEIPFNPSEMIIEILETVEPSEEVLAAIRRRKLQNYKIALDDYRLKTADHPLLPYADIVKVDYPHFEADELMRVVTLLKRAYPTLTILAEKIETHEDFQCSQQAGCDLFQGYYLAKPAPIQGQRMAQSRLDVLQLLAELNRDDASIRELTDTIQRDAFMSVRLMKMVNSAYYQRAQDITSVQTAVALLGQRRIRNLASMLALTKLDDKPHALQKLALTRGYLCEGLAANLADDSISGFTIGLFSCLDAFFDRSLESVLNELPLHTSLKEAILEHKGPMGLILATALHIERGELEAIDWSALNALGMPPERLSHAQQSAIEAANAQL